LVGGGLIRSMGCWSAVLANRRRGERQAADQRILGDGDFVKRVISSLDNVVKTNLRLSGQRIDINALVEKVSENTMFQFVNFGLGAAEKLLWKPGGQCRGWVSGNSVIPGRRLRDILVLQILA